LAGHTAQAVLRRTTVSSQTPRFRSILDGFQPYQPGRVPAAADGRTFKLSSNESPFGPLPSVVQVIAEAAAGINRYPDNGTVALTEAIAGRFGVAPAQVAVGCGSVGVTQQLLTAAAEPDTEVLFAWRSFEAYPLLVGLSGASQVTVPLDGSARHDLAAMAAAVTDRTRVIFVCNPNNPTGTVVHEPELTRFLDQVPGTCLVVLDEAYHEYIRDPAVPDGIALAAGRPNVAVLRTFSKAYGLAGLRIGFLIGDPAVAGAVRKTLLPFSVSSVAQAAAVASLAAEDELLERVDAVVKERGRVTDGLRAQGWTVPDSEANFVWLALGEDTTDFAAHCERAGIALRPFGGDGARISIGDADANDTVLEVAQAYPRRH
jgi:histidinol-phosphate aminotransferase